MDAAAVDRLLIGGAIVEPALFGPENFAGDEWVEKYVRAASRYLNLEVRTFVTWQCPPDVFVLSRDGDGLVVRSERLDALLVEMLTLRDVQRCIGGSLLDDVSRKAVLRWMSEFLIGYRRPDLAVAALRCRPSLEGLHVEIHHAFRDELLHSRPLLERAALQCISVGHELHHLVEPDTRYDLTEQVDGVGVMAHIDYDLRMVGGADDVGLTRFRAHVAGAVDATRLLKEIHADLFAVDTVLEFCIRAFECRPEDAVRSTLAAFEALAFVCFVKEESRLLAEVARGTLDRSQFDQATFTANLHWVARGRAVGRHIGISWARLEHRTRAEALTAVRENVTRVDQMIVEDVVGRQARERALNAAIEQMLDVATSDGAGPKAVEAALAAVDQDPRLRVELYFMLIGFGCHGSVDVRTFLARMSPTTDVATA